jgi:hypothetical protein
MKRTRKKGERQKAKGERRIIQPRFLLLVPFSLLLSFSYVFPNPHNVDTISFECSIFF